MVPHTYLIIRFRCDNQKRPYAIAESPHDITDRKRNRKWLATPWPGATSSYHASRSCADPLAAILNATP